MQHFYKELTLQEGFDVAAKPKESRIVGGREVGLASGISLFKAMHNNGEIIQCWKCGCIAERWISTLGKNDTKSRPVLNLFASKILPPTKRRKHPLPILVMMTRDHIIPKSHGGKDVIENLRPGCEECNSERGNEMNDEELQFMSDNPQLICPTRAARGAETRERRAKEAQARLEWHEKQAEEMKE